MAASMRDVDPAFQGAGQKAGIEIWRIEKFHPVLVPKSSHGRFFTGDSYIILKTTALKSGALRQDIHFWLGKDTSQDEAGAAAVKTVELDAALGGRAVEYREVQGYESEKFLSYFRPCIIPQEGGVSSGFKHAEAEEHKTRLYVCKGKHVVHVKEVPFARSSLSQDDVFILDTKSRIFQFNGANSSIQERAKSLEVVQYIKDTYHDGKCDIASIEGGKLMSDAESGEFWGFFGGFAPLPKKASTDDDNSNDTFPTKLFRVEKGQSQPVEADSLRKELLDTNGCFLLDCGIEFFVWMGKNTSLDARKSASGVAEELVRGLNRPKAQTIRVMEGFETVMFKSKFDSWPQPSETSVAEEGRGKVAALLKRQGVDVKGLVKSSPAKEEPEPYIECSGNLQVWRVNGEEKILLSDSDQSKLYSGDCHIFQYSYAGQETEECLIGTWIGRQSVEEDRVSAVSQASKMVESLKFLPVQARVYEGNEPLQFLTIFQDFIVFKGGLSNGYKKYIAENELPDPTYSEEGIALFRIQGTGPENMQAIQVETVASSLNSSYCYILHNGSTVFTWSGSLTNPEDQELVERQLDILKPNLQSKPQKDGNESEQFWELLGGKSEHTSQKIVKDAESDPHLFSCTYLKESLKVKEIYNFNQDDLMTEDIVILDCHSAIFVWVGQQVDSKIKVHALTMGEKYLEGDFLRENLSREAPIYVVMEGSEPAFFTRFFEWESVKSLMVGNSFQRKLAVVKNGAPILNKPKRRKPVAYGGRSAGTEKSSRTRSMSSSPDKARVRGKSPAFNALAANFENPNARNLSTPPPIVRKIYPKSVTPAESEKQTASRAEAIAALSARFDRPRDAKMIPRVVKSGPSRIEPSTIQEDTKEGEAEDDDGLPVYPYERLTTSSTDPAPDIDVTKREVYLSSQEFKEKFGMAKDAFNKLPNWKKNKMKMSLQMF